jgi:hypothetical protein
VRPQPFALPVVADTEGHLGGVRALVVAVATAGAMCWLPGSFA